MTEEKAYYAILDTDFVSKINDIRVDPDRVLADRVLEFPGYRFYCHEMMVEELSRHGTRSSQGWLRDKIKSGIIQIYTDEDILELLSCEVGIRCYSMYLSFLKVSCDTYEKGYFENRYASLEALSDGKMTRGQFLGELKACDDRIGAQQSLGEKKAYVLLQALHFIKGKNVFLFCSDDFGARRGLADTAGIPCISVIAVFMKLKNMGMPKQEAEKYFQSYIAWCTEHKQTQMYIWEFHGSYRRVKRNLQQKNLIRQRHINNNQFIPIYLLIYFPLFKKCIRLY